MNYYWNNKQESLDLLSDPMFKHKRNYELKN
jgi:hypothetical protein